MNKRGQVFLMAAVIISGIILGISSIDNSVDIGSSNEAFYDLSEEVGFETKKVLDYGVYKNESIGDLLSGDEGLFLDYKNYLAKEQLALVVGNSSGVVVYYFKETSGSIGITTGTTLAGGTVIVESMESYYTEVDLDSDGANINVKIKGENGEEFSYPFELKEGENFFFVIVKNDDGERFVAKG